MGQPWEVTFRKYGVEYHKEVLSDFGGWNADSTDATLGRDEFSEVRNYRRPTTGNYEVRTGTRVVALQNTTGATILSKCEYRNDWKNGSLPVADTFFDVTLFELSRVLYLAIYEPISGFQKMVQVSVLTDPPSPIQTPEDPPKSWVIQYAWSLVVTAKGFGTWEAFPTDNTLTTWTSSELGKDVCPVPSGVSFETKTTGDLFILDNNRVVNSGVSSLPADVKLDPNNPGQYLTIDVPIATDYWLVSRGADVTGGTASFSPNDLPWWVPNTKDVSAKESGHTAGRWSEFHNATRAWGYRFVAVQEFTNSRGEKYRVRSAPSVDLWVADMEYAPAQWGPVPTKTVAHGLSDLVHSAGSNIWTCLTCDPFGSGQAHDINAFGVATGSTLSQFFTAHGNTVFPIPNAQALENLQVLFVNYMAGNPNAAAYSNPYAYIADYLGNTSASEMLNCDGLAPYLGHVPASKLKKCPLAVFSWSDFSIGGLQGNVIEIEVYRTAHSEPEDKDNTTKNPNFEAHKYGYVGSILPATSFTDEVPDDDIDFGVPPEAQDGYLRGEFSGAIIREYDNRLVIGDVVTDYEVQGPAEMSVAARHNIGPGHPGGASAIRGFWYELSSDPASPTLTAPSYSAFFINNTNPTDGLDPIVFFAAYVDNNGVQSDSSFVASIGSGIGFVATDSTHCANLNASFVFPRGYAANVQKIRLFRGVWNTGSSKRDWIQLMEMDVVSGSGVYISKNDETGTPVQDLSTSNPFPGAVTRSSSPGSIIFSQPNQIYFWPPLNFETHHQFAPVKLLDVVLGPLYVGTDQSVSLTELNGRREELTKHIGPISRFACQKVDKILFLLSPYGMYFIEASGVVQFPAQVQTVILPYLNEEIAGVLPLANVQRASIGFLGERNELWLHLPSSKDLGGVLPHRTIVFKLGTGNNPAHTINYEMDLVANSLSNPGIGFERRDKLAGVVTIGHFPGLIDDPNFWRPEQILFQSRAMGGLFAGYYDSQIGSLVTLDCDAIGQQWQGTAAIEKSWHAGSPNTLKSLREIVVKTEGNAKITLSTGQSNPNFTRTNLLGAISYWARRFPVINMMQPLKHIVSGSAVEARSSAPYTRIFTEPDNNGVHNLSIKAIQFFAEVVSNHP